MSSNIDKQPQAAVERELAGELAALQQLKTLWRVIDTFEQALVQAEASRATDDTRCE
jgi:muconolactone delta-isomerase